jgi:glycine dehydrogenase
MAFDTFEKRHIGPRTSDLKEMLAKVGVSSLEDLIDQTIPASIRLKESMDLDEGISEFEYLNRIRNVASKNTVFKSYIGLGYYDTITPPVIQRNILENPSWYTSYTPYQAEISQGRLEALLNFQTVVCELTAMELANASLLDESSAAAEAMLMAFRSRSREAVKNGVVKFFVDSGVFRHTISVLQNRAEPLGIELVEGTYTDTELDDTFFGGMVQYPNADGAINDYREWAENRPSQDFLVIVVADILSLVLLTPPGEWGVDVVVGSTQRFGIPMGYGGPHAAYFATREQYKRNLPGRIIGVSVDAQGHHALRMALQTREQHIKRERASSNICTAQALLATMAGMYAVYHGPEGLRRIAQHIHMSAGTLAESLEELGFKQLNASYFDTLKIRLPENVQPSDIQSKALDSQVNFRYLDDRTIGISINETTTLEDLNQIVHIFSSTIGKKTEPIRELNSSVWFDASFERGSAFLTMDLFHRYRSETDMMRYIKKLERKDFSLTHSMISLGSCTMKLNAAVEMFPITWPEFAGLHPFCPDDQARGYHELIRELEEDLKIITGFEAVTFQPNSGAAGEYTGLSLIRAWHQSRNEGHRNIVLIPASAHGTNPASAVMAGMQVVVVNCDEDGNIDLGHLTELATKHKENLGAFMVTYPSTHGVFEEDILKMVDLIHENGGQVYMDGANMNAQIGYTNPAIIGADVCHLNLHKTFAIPHGGGGPGMGPVAVAPHLVEFLPCHPYREGSCDTSITPVAAAHFGSASILPISHAYIKMLGGTGLTRVTAHAILNANYIARSLEPYFDILYTGKRGYVGHEMIVDFRKFKSTSGITELDVAKRLMDYGFHAPTLSFPVHGTLMVEPTESESKYELDRFIDAMVSIYHEIEEVATGTADREDNVLRNAPHTEQVVASDNWDRPYGREKAVFPLKWVRENKFWPSIGRVDDAYGDRNLVCDCAPIDAYRKELYQEG